MKSKVKLKKFFDSLFVETKSKEYDVSSSTLAKHLVGRKVVGVKDDTLFLDNGVTLTAVDDADCCAYFNVETKLSNNLFDKRGYLREMMITDVVYNGESEEYDNEDFVIKVMSNATELFEFDVEGSEGSGYYIHSFALRIGSWDTSVVETL